MVLKYKALWALKKLKLSWKDTTNMRLDRLNEMDEFSARAYKRFTLYSRE